MDKPISTRLHGLIDDAAAAALVTLPRALGWDRRLVSALDAMAGATVAYALLTRYEFGLWRVLPMKTHLAIDGANALATLGLPWFLGAHDGQAAPLLAGFAAFEAAVTLATEPVSPVERAELAVPSPS